VRRWNNRCCGAYIVNGVPVTYNAALNRPAFQSSVLADDRGRHPASNANDGNHNTRYTNCSVSQREANPWWAVDLGGPTKVSRVDLSNVAESCCGMYARSAVLSC